MDIAIFGGSFDPFHIGHEKIVSKALEQLKVSKLFIVPTFLNPFKSSSFLDAKVRLDLLNEMYKDNKRISIIDYEVNQKGKVPTFETINYLKKTYDLNKIYLIIGADNLKEIHLWNNFKSLCNEVEFVVVSRSEIPLKNDHIKFINLSLNIEISSTKLRKKMELEYIPTNIKKKVKKLWKIQ